MERKFELSPSRENTREAHQPIIVKFHLEEIKLHFDNNIEEIKAQFDVADSLIQENRKLDAENVWRYQIVFLESAFYFYLHELTKYGLSNIFQGQWSKTTKYNNLKIDMSIVEQVVNGNVNEEWFDVFINDMYAKTTMVSFESVKDQLNLLGLDLSHIVDEVFYDLNSKEKTIDKFKRVVNGLYYRRNMIAHQSDRIHSTAEKNEITHNEVSEYINHITKIVEAINNECLRKSYKHKILDSKR